MNQPASTAAAPSGSPVVRAIEGYPLSRDYSALVKAMRQSSVVCLVPYRGPFHSADSRELDVARTLYQALGSDRERFDVSVRGYGYINTESEQEFLLSCEKNDLQFIVPQQPCAQDRIAALEADLLGSRILVQINGCYTHRRVIRRHGVLAIRVQGGFDQLSLYRPMRLGSGALLWKWEGSQ